MSVSLRSHPVGIHRRELLQVGYSGLVGLGLASALKPRSVAANEALASHPAVRRAKSVVIVFCTGAISHHDTFDLKPYAPAEIRGEFQPIATSIPGYSVCEHLPLLAARADRYAVVRSLSHRDNNHLMSTHYVLTGAMQPGGFFDKVASRDDWPCYSAGLAYLRPSPVGTPTGVNLPTFLMEGPLTWPGQHAGFLGAKYDPWQIKSDPASKDFRVDALALPQGIDVSRLDQRRALLNEVNRQQDRIAETAAARRLSSEQDQAFAMLTSSGLARAFELHHEDNATRDRFGRHSFGQTLLLARRLVQAGVPVVQCNMGRVQTRDNHGQVFSTLKNNLLPPLDRGASALLDDLQSLGLLEETLVIMLGEFGRTPKINASAGRDHWGPCFFALFAGAGVQGGQVIGRSDDDGAYPITHAWSPDDLGATIYTALGITPDTEVRDRLNRPVTLNRGRPIHPLYDATPA